MMTPLTLMAGMAAALTIAAGPGEGGKGPVTLDEQMTRATERFQKMDRDGDGYLTDADKPEKKDRFAMMDADGSGVIEKEEMLEGALTMFDARDTNGNGTIDEDERPERKRRVARGGKERAPMNRDQVAEMVSSQFDRLDTDNNGSLTEEELKAAREGRKGFRGRRGGGRKHFDKSAIDTDGDDRISLAEHLAHVEARFNAMDADGDGTLTEEERRAAWKAKRDG